MIYNSFNFLVIFPLLFLLYYAIPALWNGVTAVTYCAARWIEAEKSVRGGDFCTGYFKWWRKLWVSRKILMAVSGQRSKS